MGENFHLSNFLHLLLPSEVYNYECPKQIAINSEDVTNNQTGHVATVMSQICSSINYVNYSFSFPVALQLFVGPWLLFSFLILYTVGRTPWMGVQPVARPLSTQREQKHRINAHRHPQLEWDSNPRAQCLCGRRRFMPHTARPLWAEYVYYNEYKRK
jgi:hypothetical protein